MKLTLRAFLLLALLSCARLTHAQYQVVGAQTSTVASNLTKTVTTVQVGANPLNRFLMSRVRKAQGSQHRGTLLLLPPLGSGFQNYEIGDGGDYSKSFAGFFARRNFDVWGYSQRVQGLTAGQCESGAVDCSAMAGWGLQTIVDDVPSSAGRWRSGGRACGRSSAASRSGAWPPSPSSTQAPETTRAPSSSTARST